MDFKSLLSKKLNGKFDFLKVLKVVYNTTFSICNISFIYPENEPTLTDNQKEEIKQACQEVLGLKGKLNCKFSSQISYILPTDGFNRYILVDDNSIDVIKVKED